MNRIILVGNGFDLAHGLKTSYKDFIVDYWRELVMSIDSSEVDFTCDPFFSEEEFQTVQCKLWESFAPILSEIKNGQISDEMIEKHIIKKSDRIYIPSVLLFILTKDLYDRGWTDIENTYYELLKYQIFSKKQLLPSQRERTSLNFGGRVFLDTPSKLNSQLDFVRDRLSQYLYKATLNASINKNIVNCIFEPIRMQEVSTKKLSTYHQHIENIISSTPSSLMFRWNKYYVKNHIMESSIRQYKNYKQSNQEYSLEELAQITDPLAVPNKILLLSFNYTSVTDLYADENNPFISVNHIHGTTDCPSTMIFGYGDEIDPNFAIIRDLNDNEYLKNFKSYKYLETNHYRNLLSFMEDEPFQISIMGHSCGNSDRTLLNTMFEHPNCISIKPYYYRNAKGKDNYLDLIQNISRSFTDMQLMRDTIVNYSYCSPLPQS